MIGAAAGLRQGELFGLGEEDIDFDAMEIHVRRQIKRLGSFYVFALPKSDQERTVPMSDSAAEVLRWHIKNTRIRPYSLPWERPDGEQISARLLFRWRDDKHIRARGYNKQVWKPALVAADVIPPPIRDEKGELMYLASRKDGMHALRHYHASVTLADGVNIRELSEYLGHGDPGFTLRLYTTRPASRRVLPGQTQNEHRSPTTREGTPSLLSLAAAGAALFVRERRLGATPCTGLSKLVVTTSIGGVAAIAIAMHQVGAPQEGHRHSKL